MPGKLQERLSGSERNDQADVIISTTKSVFRSIDSLKN